MDAKFYTLTRIEGEYAYLREDGKSPSDEIFIAMALLPFGADVGSRLKCEYFEYTLVD
jgi:hypothetical protein